MSKPVAYVEQPENGPIGEWALAAWQGFLWDGYDVRFLTPESLTKFVLRDNESKVITSLGAGRPFVGSIEATQALFRRFGLSVPRPLNVPDELQPFAGRSIERLRLEDALLKMERDHRPQFIKPADEAKLFTGGVVATPAHVAFLFADLSPDTPVLLSPEVNIVTEYRVFVNRDREIAAMRHYLGDPFVRPSKLFVRKMIDSYTKAPRCYSLDVGVTASGKTIVVECNDFWALGTYGMDPVAYSRMLAQRWHEIITTLNQPVA